MGCIYEAELRKTHHNIPATLSYRLRSVLITLKYLEIAMGFQLFHLHAAQIE